MFDNIDAVLQRGELIESTIIREKFLIFYYPCFADLSKQASALADGSKRFRKEARRLNLSTSMAAKLAIGAAIFIFIIFIRFWFF